MTIKTEEEAEHVLQRLKENGLVQLDAMPVVMQVHIYDVKINYRELYLGIKEEHF